MLTKNLAEAFALHLQMVAINRMFPPWFAHVLCEDAWAKCWKKLSEKEIRVLIDIMDVAEHGSLESANAARVATEERAWQNICALLQKYSDSK